METGYGEAPEAVAITVTATLAAGAVGANIEDSSSQRVGHPMLDYDLSVARIRAGREAANDAGVPLLLTLEPISFEEAVVKALLMKLFNEETLILRRGQVAYSCHLFATARQWRNWSRA